MTNNAPRRKQGGFLIACAILVLVAASTVFVERNALVSPVSFDCHGDNHTSTASLESHTAVSLENDEFITFGKAVSTLNWTAYDALNETDKEGLKQFARQVYYLAFTYAIMEPKVPVNETCKPPPLSTPPTADQCSPSISNVFNLQVRTTPRKVGHAIQLGFDIDTLEILLHELDTVVDKFFIVEWTLPHNQYMNPKPLAWDAVKSRFAFALDKVVHIIMDDVDTAHVNNNEMWTVENLQEQRRWKKILEWQNLTRYFEDHDIIGFGDTDEIPSRENVHLLKHCEWKNSDPVDVGIWFTMGRVNQAFRTDFPVRGHPYSLGDPTYYLFGKAMTINGTVSRNRGKSPNSILGGAHFTHYGYLIYQLMKGMSCSECVNLLPQWMQQLRDTVKTGDWSELEQRKSEMGDGRSKRIIPLKQLPESEKEVVYLPWFYDCNRDRYPMWEGRPDSRIAR